MPLYVVNSTSDSRGRRVPVVEPAGWVGNLYRKGGVFKYLILTPEDISGQPGVVGPFTRQQAQAAIDADNGRLKGWRIDELPLWAVDGVGAD